MAAINLLEIAKQERFKYPLTILNILITSLEAMQLVPIFTQFCFFLESQLWHIEVIIDYI